MRWKIAWHFQIQTRGIPTLAGGAMARLPSLEEREDGMERKVGRHLRVDMWGSPCNPSTFVFIPSHLPTIPPSPFSLFLVPTRGGRSAAFAHPPRGQQRWELGLLEFFDGFFCGISIGACLLYFVVDYDFVWRDRRHGRVLIEFCCVCVGVSIVFCCWLWFCRSRSSESFVWFWLVLELCFDVDYDFVIG